MMRKSKQRGLSLLELMVAMAIGLIVVLVVYQLFVVSEATRRSSVAGTDAQMSAAIAVSAMQDQIRNAGYGLTSSDSVNGVKPIGCTVKGFDARSNAGAYPGFPNISFTLAPVQIVQGADNNAGTGVGTQSDTITIVYSDLDYPTVMSNLLAGMVSPTADIKVTNRFGVTPGNVVLLSEKGTTTTPVSVPLPAGTPACVLVEVTGAPTIAGQKDIIQHATGTYLDASGTNTNVRFNGPTGTQGLQFSSKASVYNLGQSPSVTTFSVNASNQLVMSNLLGTLNQPLVDGVVGLQAQYGIGKDTDGDGFADQFNPTQAGQGWMATKPAANQWGEVVAVRFAVLARGNLIEPKEKGTNVCVTTLATSPEFTWSGGQFDVTATPDWNCYRYRKFEAVVPLRNMIWMPT